MHPDSAIAVLRRTPSALRALLGGLGDDWTRQNEGGASWSPYDVVGHLIEGERTDWIPRARIILESGEARPFEPFDRFAQFERSEDLSMDDLLAEFEELRTENIVALGELGIADEDLERRGTHPELGPVTLSELISTWVVHDLSHLAQIARVMAHRMDNEVGPWREFIPILHRRHGA